MEQNDLRAGALAVAKDGRLVLAHGYTFGEPNYPLTDPMSLFRIASASKPITGVGIYQLLESGALHLGDKVADILNVKLPDGNTPVDDGTHFFNSVTVQHLLQHQGGWIDQPTFFKDAKIAEAFHHPVPVSIEELISWGVGQPMDFQPGSQGSYSNFGYLLLGRVIAAKRKQSYVDAIRKHVFAPLGVRRAFMARTRFEERLPGEVKYHAHPPVSNPSTVVPNQQAPLQYGGENYANFEGFGSWVISAPDYVRMLAGIPQLLTTPLAQQLFWQFLGLTLPAGVTAFSHGAVFGGGTFGFCSLRTDGIAMAGFWNTTRGDGNYKFNAPDPNVPGAKKSYTAHEVCWHDVANKIEADKAWPSYDLFGQHFPQITRFDARLNGAVAELAIDALQPDGTFKGTITHDGKRARSKASGTAARKRSASCATPSRASRRRCRSTPATSWKTKRCTPAGSRARSRRSPARAAPRSGTSSAGRPDRP